MANSSVIAAITNNAIGKCTVAGCKFFKIDPEALRCHDRQSDVTCEDVGSLPDGDYPVRRLRLPDSDCRFFAAFMRFISVG